MSQEHLIGLECSACSRINYHTDKNKKQNPDRLVLKKYCRWCKAHKEHKETKLGKGK